MKDLNSNQDGQMINEQLIVKKQKKEKVVYNAVELMALGNIDPKYLMSPIFPQKGTAILAGKPDTGKSQLARQLCIQVALGENKFLDFDLKPLHKRAIYVATEDNQEATTYLISKQFKGLDKAVVENLRFIFADTMEQKEILKKLNNELKKCPADLVVVDSFGDIFTGGDSNNNMAMRNTVKLFDKVAKSHNCLVLFVHHINKGAYRISPGQEHIQGGSGLTQKVRLAIVLSEGEGSIRYFTVVKGNYCPKKYKQNSMELLFSETDFLFSNTGRIVPTNEIGTKTSCDRKQDTKKELENFAAIILENNSMSYGDFINQFMEATSKGGATAKRAVKILTDSEFIEKVDGKYRLKQINSGDDDSEEYNEILS